jgi:hypothetical protein
MEHAAETDGAECTINVIALRLLVDAENERKEIHHEWMIDHHMNLNWAPRGLFVFMEITMTQVNSVQTAMTPVIVYGQDKDRHLAAYFSSEHAALATKAAESLKFKVAKVTNPELGNLAAVVQVGRPHEKGKNLLAPVTKAIFDTIVVAVAANGSKSAKQTADTQKLPKHWDQIREGSLVLAHWSAKDGWWEAVVTAVDGDMLTIRWRDFSKYPQILRHRFSIALLRPAIAEPAKSS